MSNQNVILLRNVQRSTNDQLNMLIDYHNIKNYDELYKFIKESFSFEFIVPLQEVSIEALLDIFYNESIGIKHFTSSNPDMVLDLSDDDLDYVVRVGNIHDDNDDTHEMVIYRRNGMIGIEVMVDLEAAFDEDKIVSLMQQPEVDISTVDTEDIPTHKEIDYDEFIDILKHYSGVK